LRLREKGSDGGHNGLKDIDRALEGGDYSRLRVGIGNSFNKGRQVNFVLGKWNKEEQDGLITLMDRATQACISFATIGAKFTMEKFNKNVLKD
jgi:PTH1 family peptidyl-tRNA hydrolase